MSARAGAPVVRLRFIEAAAPRRLPLLSSQFELAFKLRLNPRTARALGLTMLQAPLPRADEVNQ